MNSLINPADPPDVQNRKLLRIAEVLMARVEASTDDGGAAYAQFQRAVRLEDQVRSRTAELQQALALLNGSNTLLADATREAESARQNLANAIETVQDGFALFDPQDRLVMCNSRFGLTLRDVHPVLKPGLHFMDYVERVSRSPDLVLLPGETATSWAAARLRRHADSRVIFTVPFAGDRWVQVSEHRTRDGGTVILQTDLTDIIRLERLERGKLLDDQARIVRATLDHISQGVGIFDEMARLVGWNARLADLLTLPLPRVRLGMPFASLIAGFGSHLRLGNGFTVQALEAWVTSTAPRAPLTFEITRDDDFVLAAFAQEMPDRGFVMSFSDITAERAALRAISEANETLEARVSDRTLELAEALEKAERANAARARFVAAASHDLLQPLSAAKLFLASISDEAMPPTAQSTLEKAQNALKSVEEILGALLDISKLESGPTAVDVGPVRLDQILAQLRDEFAPLAAGKGLRLNILPCRVTVQSDATYLRRILQNLIGNAIRYTAKGRVLVGTRHLPDAVRIEVLDTGPGIPEAERTNIFREFHRLNARASASEGMGLGLAIVERACALLGHDLTLTSRPGHGARFAVTVPRADPGHAMPAQPTAPEWRDGEGDRIVLLVENDAELRQAICLLLEKWRFNVIDVGTAEEALSLLAEIGILPDLYLIDDQLGPGMTGATLARHLQDRHGPLALRLITAQRAEEMTRRAPGIRVLEKPLNSSDLAAFLLTEP